MRDDEDGEESRTNVFGLRMSEPASMFVVVFDTTLGSSATKAEEPVYPLPAYAARPGCTCTERGSGICWALELGKPADEDRDAVEEVRRVCSSCGFVVLL